MTAIATDERRTPGWLYRALDEEFRFTIDAAAAHDNTKCQYYFGIDVREPDEAPVGVCLGDALAQSWMHAALSVGVLPRFWLNPPYSRGSIPTWMMKAEQEAAAGATVVSLISADTSTDYFHRYVLERRHEVRLLNTRLAFEGAPLDKAGRLAPAKFGSVIIIMRPTHRHWRWL